MIIQVTQGDIDFGKRGRALECPLVRAISRATGLNCAICFNKYTFIFNVDFSKGELLPPEARDFYRRFDDGEEVKPFTFEIAYPFISEITDVTESKSEKVLVLF